jgi:membrane protein DedA with SNARE-associated domain/membrane-associated phospholipid phosphatase
METVQPYLDYFAANPGWAIAIVFLIAFGEALLIIGLFVPSTVALVGAGMLVGTGQLGFWPVFLATAIGAIAGDQVSYWAGRFWGQQLKTMWPMSAYPQLVIKGEDYVRQHGGKSIAIGRFVPGVKAVVPGIVGMLGMSQLYFVIVNFSSGIVWAAAHVFPGILLGQTLALAGELSDRLALVMILLLVVLGVVGWLVRLAAASVSPYVDRLLRTLSVWFLASRRRPLRRLGLALRPGRPRAKALLLFALICVGGLLMLADIVTGLVIQRAFSNLDLSVQNLLSDLRSAPADDLMVPITMLGDGIVIYMVAAVIIAWLAWYRAWRAAIATLVTIALARLSVVTLKALIERPRPLTEAGFNPYDSFSFPSGHTVMAATLLGVIAILASHAMGRWSKALVAAVAAMIAVAIGFSRLYLGVHWTSDVIGGFVIALILVTAFGIVIEAIPARRIRPYGLMATVLAAYVVAGGVHVAAGFDGQLKRYTAVPKIMTFETAEWEKGGWKVLPAQRIDLGGTPEEAFDAQWVGDQASMEKHLAAVGWTVLPKWTWRDGLAYLKDDGALQIYAPRPLLHEGLKAKVTAVKPLVGDASSRMVLRAYRTDAVINLGGKRSPVLLVSISKEQLNRRKHLYAMPGSSVASADEKKTAIAALEQGGVVMQAQNETNAAGPIAIIKAGN